MLELTSDATAAAENASLARESLQAEKDAVQSATERADSAEKLAKELQENMRTLTTETGGVSEALRVEKVGVSFIDVVVLLFCCC